MRRDLEHYSRSRTLELPPRYSIEPMHADSGDGHQMLLLTRADGSPVVAFEFSALGPGPGRIHEIAVEDAEKVAAGELNTDSTDETTQP